MSRSDPDHADDLDDRRPVMAVLAPDRRPEPVVAEAVALAVRRSSPLRLLVLRRTIGFSTDAALAAAVERSADLSQRELLTRAAASLPCPTSGGIRAGAGPGVAVDVVRVAGTDFDAPSAWVTRRVLATARRRGVGVVVLPAVLLGPQAPPRSPAVVPVEDVVAVRTGAAGKLRVHPRSAARPAPHPLRTQDRTPPSRTT